MKRYSRDQIDWSSLSVSGSAASGDWQNIKWVKNDCPKCGEPVFVPDALHSSGAEVPAVCPKCWAHFAPVRK